MAELPRGDDLAAMFDAVWRCFAEAVVEPDAPLRWPVVATMTPSGPSARLMVLRGVDAAARTLRFYTDRRAAKVAELAADPRVAVTGYDPAARLQLRLRGCGRILGGSAVADCWRGIGDSGRRAYATIAAPGTRLDGPGSGLPAEIVPAEAEANFAILEVTADRLEWLLLAPSGHRRARYEFANGSWTGSWRVP